MPLTASDKLQIIERTWDLEQTGTVPCTIEIGQPHCAANEFFDDDAAELAWHKACHDQRHYFWDYGELKVDPVGYTTH